LRYWSVWKPKVYDFENKNKQISPLGIIQYVFPHTPIAFMYGPNSGFTHNTILIESRPLLHAFVLTGIHNTSNCCIQ